MAERKGNKRFNNNKNYDEDYNPKFRKQRKGAQIYKTGIKEYNRKENCRRI